MKSEHISLNLSGPESTDNADVVKPEQQESTESDPFAKGRERMESVGNFFSSIKEKAGSLYGDVKGSISRFWEKSKSFGSEAVAATLSVDDLAAKGIGSAIEYTRDRVQDVGESIGEGVVAIDDWMDDKKEKAVNFVNTKVEQVRQFGQDKVELAKDVSFFVKEKTSEGLDKAKDGVLNRYNKVKAYGENALSSAKVEAARLKQAYRENMNNLRIRRLEAELKIVLEKEAETSAAAEQIRQQKEALAAKMSILQDLQMAA